MKKRNRALALMLSLCLSICVSMPPALAEGPVSPEALLVTATAALPEHADMDVAAIVNGQEITWAEVKADFLRSVAYFGEFEPATLDDDLHIAMDSVVRQVLVGQIAQQYGLDQYTAEEMDAIRASADAAWQAALEDLILYHQAQSGTEGDAMADADYAEAEAYYNERGYNQDTVLENHLASDLTDRVNAFVAQAAAVDENVTEEETVARYNEMLVEHEALYANDATAYEWALQNRFTQITTELPVYYPAGYRYIKSILLIVDEGMQNEYAALAKQLEAQETLLQYSDGQDATAQSPDPAAVQQLRADLDARGAAILAAAQAALDEIYQRCADGEDFDSLIEAYSSAAAAETTGVMMYAISTPGCYDVARESLLFTPEFVQAAFALDTIGAVSEPFVDTDGVHILQYVGDRPAGPVPLNDSVAESIGNTLVSERKDDAITAWWDAAATIVYTGLIPRLDTP